MRKRKRNGDIGRVSQGTTRGRREEKKNTSDADACLSGEAGGGGQADSLERGGGNRHDNGSRLAKMLRSETAIGLDHRKREEKKNKKQKKEKNCEDSSSGSIVCRN